MNRVHRDVDVRTTANVTLLRVIVNAPRDGPVRFALTGVYYANIFKTYTTLACEMDLF